LVDSNSQLANQIKINFKKKHIKSTNSENTARTIATGLGAGVDSSFVMKPIGFLESVYREKFGTPR
jgi:hypothetical protein